MKTVYLFDTQTGAYAGPYDAQESPLQPGAFIAPDASVSIAPPAFNAQSHCARWSGSAWVIEALPAPPEPEPPTDAEIIERLPAGRPTFSHHFNIVLLSTIHNLATVFFSATAGTSEVRRCCYPDQHEGRHE